MKNLLYFPVLLTLASLAACDIHPDDSAGDSPADSTIPSDSDTRSETGHTGKTDSYDSHSDADDSSGSDSVDSGDDGGDPDTITLSCDGAADDGRAIKLCGADGDYYIGAAGLAGHCDADGDGSPDLVVEVYDEDHLLLVTDFSMSTTLSSDALISADKADRFGGYPTCDGDHDGDGYNDLAVEAWEDELWSEGAYIFDGPITMGSTVDDATGAIQTGLWWEGVGSLAWVPDMGASGDGLLIGANVNSYSESHTYFEAAPVGDLDATDTTAQFTYTWLDDQIVGKHVDSMDMDGDGVVELIIGVSDNDGDETDPHELGEILFVSPTSTGEVWLDSEHVGLSGDDGIGPIASIFDVGDLDDDGYPDLYTSYVDSLSDGRSVGAVYYGPVDTYVQNSDATLDLTDSDASNDKNGAILGDMDGDGHYGTLAITRYAVYLYTEPPSGALTEADATVIETDGAFYPRCPTAIGDVNGDGLEDLAVSDPYDDAGSTDTHYNSGAVYIFFGGAW